MEKPGVTTQFTLEAGLRGKGRYLYELECVRGLAILLVFFFHAYGATGYPETDAPGLLRSYLIGGNTGAGKSTLMRLIMLMDRATRGTVSIDGMNLARVSNRNIPAHRRDIGVVFQNQTWRNRCQFSFACDGIPERVSEPEPWEQAQSIADQVSGGTLYLAEVADATHYHANYVYPHWAPRMTRVARIGAHIFYKFRNA